MHNIMLIVSEFILSFQIISMSLFFLKLFALVLYMLSHLFIFFFPLTAQKPFCEHPIFFFFLN